MKKLSWRYLLLFLVGTVTVWQGCQNDDSGPVPFTDAEINNWILDSMEYWYYWNDKIPASPNMSLDPGRFFNSLLYTNSSDPNGYDRFSWIEEDAQQLSDNLAGQSKSFGYDVTFFYVSDNSNKVVAIVIYPYLNSEAEQKGLKRGDVIGKVNGEELYYNSNSDNNLGIIYDTGSSQTISIGAVNENGAFQEQKTLAINPATIQEDPVYYHNVYAEGGKNIGYLVYNGFIRRPASSSSGFEYDDRVRDIFGEFKSQQVSELVLDLRYNLGGSVLSARILASLIVKEFTENMVFARFEFNEQRDPKEGGALPFLQEANRLNALDRVYVLVSGNTASASELVINSLRPFMDVILIGDDNTVGKNVASTTIYDRTGKIKWGLQPIVLKIYNALYEADFTEGFSPDIEVGGENFLPFGDTDESFLSRAIQEITGQSPDIAVAPRGIPRRVRQADRQVGSSLDYKRRAGEMYINPDQLPRR